MQENYMALAMELARQAGEDGEVPVGCIIVRNGQIIGAGRNRKEKEKDPLLHAEIIAIRQACANIDDWRLEECQLYVTLEPCPMCAGAILNARVGMVVYGATDVKFGACGGVMNLFEEAFGFKPKLYGGVLAQECAALLSMFFGKLRQA